MSIKKCKKKTKKEEKKRKTNQKFDIFVLIDFFALVNYVLELKYKSN